MEDDAKTLEQRVKESLRSLRDNVEGLGSEAQELKNSFQQLQQRASIGYQIKRHPLLALGLALGGGLIAGRRIFRARHAEEPERTRGEERPPSLNALRTGFLQAFLRSSGERFGQQALALLAAQIGAYAAKRVSRAGKEGKELGYSARFLHRRNGHLWDERV